MTARGRLSLTVVARRAVGPGAAALCGLLLAGGAACRRIGPGENTPPPIEMPAKFSHAGVEAVAARWWLSFDDSRLNALIDQALSENLSLQVTWARLAQAEATARRAGAALKPSLTGTAGASRTRRDGSGRDEAEITSSLSLGLAVSYELDLWGRIRSVRDAAEMDLRATRTDLDAAAITLTARVADTWCQLLDSHAQVELIAEQIVTNGKYLAIVWMRFRQRQVRAIDVLQQQRQLEATRCQLVRAKSRREVLQHALAVLVGKVPTSQLAGTDGPLPALPALPRTGVPSQLVRRRPDIRGAALRLASAQYSLAAAAADRFPRVSISARTSASGAKTRELFDNWLASLAANLTAPILDGGRRAAEVDRAAASAERSLHSYGQTVLDALREVEDALVRERRRAEFLGGLAAQLGLSQKILDQSRQHYLKGAMTYLHVLAALRSHQSLQRQVLSARLDLIRNRITLYRALGGSWALERKAPRLAGSPVKAPGR